MKNKSNTNREEYRRVSYLYNKWIHGDFKSVHTYESYKTSMKLFFKDYLKAYKGLSFDTFDVEKALCKECIEEWETWLSKRGNTPQTINLRRSNLIAFLNYLANEDLTYVKYYLDAKTIRYKKGTHIKQNALSLEATESIINAPNIDTKTGLRDTVLMGMMYCTGARLREILSVRIKDLTFTKDGQTGSVLFHGKGNKYRCIPLNGNIINQLLLYVKRAHGDRPAHDSYLFFSTIKGKNEMLSSRAIEKRIKIHAKTAMAQCGDVPEDMHSHLFRHTRATNWVKERHRLPVVSKLLGHEHLETTMLYLDISQEMMNEAATNARSPLANSIEQNWNEDEIDSLFDF